VSDEFRQEVETQEAFRNLQAKICKLEANGTREEMDLQITFNPHFQMNIECYCPVNLYEHTQNHKRSVFGWPWFSDPSQEEKFKIWSAITVE
jgi:hypothetical protein